MTFDLAGVATLVWRPENGSISGPSHGLKRLSLHYGTNYFFNDFRCHLQITRWALTVWPAWLMLATFQDVSLPWRTNLHFNFAMASVGEYNRKPEVKNELLADSSLRLRFR